MVSVSPSLGISYDVLSHVRNSNTLDHADAVAMNRASMARRWATTSTAC